MKKIFVLLSIALMSVVACQRNEIPHVGGDDTVLDGATGKLAVSIQMPVEETKVVKGSVQDSKINSIQLFVFGSDGRLETSRYESSYDGSSPITITSKTGTKTVYAVLNSKRLDFGNIDKFEGTSSEGAGLAYNDLNENTETKLIMSGKNTINVEEWDKNKGSTNADIQPLVIRVKRLAAKVQFDKVTVDFRNTAYEGGQLDIQEIYLVNVVGKSPYGVQSVGTLENPATTGVPIVLPNNIFNDINNWYWMGTRPGSIPAGDPSVIYDLGLTEYVCSGTTVANESKVIDRVFFCYPNRSEVYQSGSDTPQSPVHTSLVIKARIQSGSFVSPAIDKSTWYTFDLPVIEANKVYQIKDIKITMAGADNPGERVITGKADMSVVVDEWTSTVELYYDF